MSRVAIIKDIYSTRWDERVTVQQKEKI
jgi:hypothetical protein